jgi:hypothetical protein
MKANDAAIQCKKSLGEPLHPLAQTHAALDRLASGQQFGKVAVSLG